MDGNSLFNDFDLPCDEQQTDFLELEQTSGAFAISLINESMTWMDSVVSGEEQVHVQDGDMSNAKIDLAEILIAESPQEAFRSTAPNDNDRKGETNIQLAFPITEEVSPLPEVEIDPSPILGDEFSLGRDVSEDALTNSPIGSFTDVMLSEDAFVSTGNGGGEGIILGMLNIGEPSAQRKNSTSHRKLSADKSSSTKKKIKKGNKGKKKIPPVSGCLSVDSILSPEQKEAILKESKPKMTRRRARFPQAQPSKFCHVCARQKKVARQMVCSKIKEGVCRKVICEKCFKENNWDWESAQIASDSWLCPHCLGMCPARSQCSTYKRVNDKLREDRILTQHLRPVKASKKSDAVGSSSVKAFASQAATILPRPELSSPPLFVVPLPTSAMEDPNDAIVIPETIFDA